MDNKTFQQLAQKWEEYLASIQPSITPGQGGDAAEFKFGNLTMTIPRGAGAPTRQSIRVR